MPRSIRVFLMLTMASSLLQLLQRIVRTAARIFSGQSGSAGLPKSSGDVMTDPDYDDSYDDSDDYDDSTDSVPPTEFTDVDE